MCTQLPWWDEFRSRMPIAEQWAYFDHAAVAPLSGPAQQAIQEWADDAAAHGELHWGSWQKRVENVRALAAAFLGASLDEIALIRNTTEGINIVAEGFPFKEGDNVVTLGSEFPSNLYPWMNLADRGVETRLVPTEDERLDLNRLDEQCDDRTRIVTVSWVGYATGWRNDVDAVAEIAHRHGALLFLDAIQGLGVFPLDVRQTPVDFLAADGHKWLLGPEGAGLFYVRQEHLDVLRPIGVGWNSVRHAGDFSNTRLDLKPSAARYEGGSYNMAGLLALGASLELLTGYGVNALSNRLLELTDHLCNQLEDVGAEIASCRDDERRSGIVSFVLRARNPQAVRQHCRDRGVILNCRADRLRASPHAYMTEQDLDRLLRALAQAP